MAIGNSPVFRVLRWIALVVLVLVLLPYLITPLYLVVNPVSTLMVWRKMTGEPVVRTWTPLSAVAPALPLSVIVAEDGKFCTHHGIDFGELRAAFRDADDLSDMRGGSTLTQQTAKNLFLWQGRSVVRKLLEFPLALWVDLILGKRRVMEIYLNIAEWGPGGEFGIEAGSRKAFGKSARDLNTREAAAMASILPNPIVRSAGHPSTGVRRLTGIYEARGRRFASRAACLRR